jgi:small ligand-binding sensory domain FIST
MPFFTALSTHGDTRMAVREVIDRTRSVWKGDVDLALLFWSPQHREAIAGLAAALLDEIPARCLAGCPGETVIADDREVEDGPALCLWLARWSRPVRVTPFRLDIEQTGDGYSLLGWPDELTDADPARSLLLTLGDPFTFPVETFLDQLNAEKHGLPLAGGMASGAAQEGAAQGGDNFLLCGCEAVPTGAVCVLLEGELGYRTVVSQGCRPLGKPLVVTKAQDNVILELGGKTPMQQLQDLWLTMTPRDHQLVQRGLMIGRAVSEYRDTFRRGDFLVRNLIGLDRATGAIAVGDHIRVGQTVQFHVRDADSADEDLRLLLAGVGPRAGDAGDCGGLLFSCNGRGSRLFDRADHDAHAVREALGQIPLAGFFAQGELGPIGGQNFIHGFTASLVLFGEW